MNRNESIEIEKVANGFLVRPCRCSIPVSKHEVFVFNDFESMLGWMCEHFFVIPNMEVK